MENENLLFEELIYRTMVSAMVGKYHIPMEDVAEFTHDLEAIRDFGSTSNM